MVCAASLYARRRRLPVCSAALPGGVGSCAVRRQWADAPHTPLWALILGGSRRGARRAPKSAASGPPCGAKPRGGGGAPPTNLILLRNQREPSLESRARQRPGGPGGPGGAGGGRGHAAAESGPCAEGRASKKLVPRRGLKLTSGPRVPLRPCRGQSDPGHCVPVWTALVRCLTLRLGCPH